METLNTASANLKTADLISATSQSAAQGASPRSFVYLHFSVCDSGIGIARENLERIFSPFTQADASTTRQFGGTGLGLAISQRLVEFMGGRLHVESTLGKGSTFSFVIPLQVDPGGEGRMSSSTSSQKRTNEDSSTTASHGFRKLRVLLAEDTRANQKLVLYILGKRGHSVDIAENGLKALDLLRAADYDVILMDVQMPELDGFRATQEVRKMADVRKSRVPIIALTAYAMKGDREQCLAAGMDGYLSKPISPQDLLDAIENAVQSSTALESRL